MEWDAPGSTKNTVDPGSGYAFLVGKYGGGKKGGESLVWYVGGMTEEFTIPVKAPNKKGLSSWTLYNPTTNVPDGGMTLMLLGGALVGMETLRRRYRV
jgi:hypothetical protein